MELSCFLTFEGSSVQCWTPECVDQILIKGDNMYLHALMNDLIPDTSTLLAEHLPTTATSADGRQLFVQHGSFSQRRCLPSYQSCPPYLSLSDALTNTLLVSPYAILILSGYMLAIVKSCKSEDEYYIFDSHARNSSGLPNPNGTAVLMKFSNVSSLKSQIFDLAQQLNSYEFEVVPITFQTNDAKKALSDSSAWFTEIRKECTVSNSEILTKSQGSTFMTVAGDESMSKSVTFGPRSGCKRKLTDNFEHRKVRHQRKKANESDQERELRLENIRKVASCGKQKFQLGLKCNTISYKNKKKNETSKERETRLTKNREYIKNYRKLKSQNCDNFEQNSAQMSTITETSHFPISDCDKSDMEKTTYLSSFNKRKFGEIHDQP